MKYIIRKSINNYYKKRTAIGPCFGATKENAYVFNSRIDAARAMNHWAFADCDIDEIRKD